MPRSTSQLASLEVHKRLLLVESEVNRVQLFEECARFREETNELLAQGHTIMSTAATAAMAAAGFSMLRRLMSQRQKRKTSILESLMSVLRLGASFWTNFRTRSS
jgi:hypothetical protein